MEATKLRAEALRNALEELNDSLTKLAEISDEHLYFTQVRDSVIQRFEFSIDSFWKFLGVHLVEQGLVPAKNAYSVLRECFAAKILSESEYEDMLAMIKDRNITSHTYDESLAEAISARVQSHHKLMREIFNRLQTSLNR